MPTRIWRIKIRSRHRKTGLLEGFVFKVGRYDHVSAIKQSEDLFVFYLYYILARISREGKHAGLGFSQYDNRTKPLPSPKRLS